MTKELEAIADKIRRTQRQSRTEYGVKVHGSFAEKENGLEEIMRDIERLVTQGRQELVM